MSKKSNIKKFTSTLLESIEYLLELICILSEDVMSINQKIDAISSLQFLHEILDTKYSNIKWIISEFDMYNSFIKWDIDSSINCHTNIHHTCHETVYTVVDHETPTGKLYSISTTDNDEILSNIPSLINSFIHNVGILVIGIPSLYLRNDEKVIIQETIMWLSEIRFELIIENPRYDSFFDDALLVEHYILRNICEVSHNKYLKTKIKEFKKAKGK